jgi:hypothetical protein
MLVRARHDPAINQGDPATWAALRDVILRHQYDVAPLWPRRAPVWLQIGNVFEYADWQVALGLHQEPGPALARTAATLVFAIAGWYGSLAHRRMDRTSWRAMVILCITATLGVVIYLNLRAGPSYGYGMLPDDALREARERDYFFTLGFVCWGAWAGMGLVAAARALARRLSSSHVGTERMARHSDRLAMLLPWCAVAVTALPIALNWAAIRAQRYDAQREIEQIATATLAALPPRAVMFAEGDNDTYPLWYGQQVRHLRPDVTVVTLPMLGQLWYRRELARRYGLLDSTTTTTWRGLSATQTAIRGRASQQGRPVVASPIARAVHDELLHIP